MNFCSGSRQDFRRGVVSASKTKVLTTSATVKPSPQTNCQSIQSLSERIPYSTKPRRLDQANSSTLSARRAERHYLRVQLDRFDDVVEFVRDGDRSVGVAGLGHSSAAKRFVE